MNYDSLLISLRRLNKTQLISLIDYLAKWDSRTLDNADLAKIEAYKVIQKAKIDVL
jgi:hypothetical protein